MFYRLTPKVDILNGCGACLQNRPLRIPGGTNPGPGRRLGGPTRAPAPVESGWEPTVTRPDPMTEGEREAWLDDLAELSQGRGV